MKQYQREIDELGRVVIPKEVREALATVPYSDDKPTVIIAKTIKCRGVDYLENTVESHYRYVPDDKLEDVIKELEVKKI